RPNATPGSLHPTQAFGHGEAIAAYHTHFHGRKPFGRITTELCFRLIARRPTTTGVATNGAACGAEGLVDRYAKRLGFHVPDRNVHPGNGFHDHATPTTHLRLRDTTFQGWNGPRAVVHLFVQALGKHGVFAHEF